MSAGLTPKQRQFNAAMDKYEKQPLYQWIGGFVSLTNIGLQGALAFWVLPQSIGWVHQVWVFVLAYVAADFINGLVHMAMDNNDAYESPAGPLIAAFHLHHRTPVYKVNPLIVVYYRETGAKIWLVFFLAASVLGVAFGHVSGTWAYGLLYFGILSSVAEVSHYLCHVPSTKVWPFLGGIGLLLSKRHHMHHHTEDNKHYAFLNGMTDPVLNVIAKVVYPGYKNTTDTHYARYTGQDTHNRK